MSAFKVIFVIALLMNTAAAAFVQLPQSFFKDWKSDGKVERYDSKNLYIYMDGAAELYLETGFDELKVQSYKNKSGKELLLELFRMKSDTAALAMFLWETTAESGQSELSVPCKINSYQLVFYCKEYFVRIANFAGDRSLMPAMKKIAKTILKKIGQKKNNDLFLLRFLPEQERIADSERIFRGKLGLRRFLGRSLKLSVINGKVYALGAKYRRQSQSSYYQMVLFYPDEVKARTVWDTLIKQSAEKQNSPKIIEIPINSTGNIKAGLKRNLLYLTLYMNK